MRPRRSSPASTPTRHLPGRDTTTWPTRASNTFPAPRSGTAATWSAGPSSVTSCRVPASSARGEDKWSGGLFAGTLRHHDGRFWYVTTNSSDFDAGQLLVWAIGSRRAVERPGIGSRGLGVDPDIGWDDGHCYLTWKAWTSARLRMRASSGRLDLESGRLKDRPTRSGRAVPGLPEGPHLFQADGIWYLLLAEGGTERGHAVTIARGPHPPDPFEGCPDNPIFTHRSSTHPVQNVGHADLVWAPDGGWARLPRRPARRPSPSSTCSAGRRSSPGWTGSDGWPVFDEGRFRSPGDRVRRLLRSARVRSALGRAGWGARRELGQLDPSGGLRLLHTAADQSPRPRSACCAAGFAICAGRPKRPWTAPAGSCSGSTTGTSTG